MNRKERLLIFDCDGVLIDSEAITMALDAEMLTALGLPHTVQDVADKFLGISAEAANAIIEQELGHPIPDGFNALYHSRLEASFAKDLHAMPGVDKFLARWKGPVCVASSSSGKRLQSTLTQTGLYDRLKPHIFSAEMVEHGKPAPDLFLYAATRMGFELEKCIVIEDSINGVRAACAAGMKCFGFAGGSHCDDTHAHRLLQVGAMTVFSSMDKLETLIAAI